MTKKIIKIFVVLVLVAAPFSLHAVTLSNPIGTTDIRVLAGTIIKTVLGLSGVAALLMFVYGGSQWILSSGEPKKVQKGKDTLTWAAIGLVFIFISYTLLYTLLSALGSAA